MKPSELLAHDLGLTEEEIVGFGMARYGMDVDRGPDSVVVAIREDLDQFCVRSVPQNFWPSEHPDSRCRCRAFGGVPHNQTPACRP